MANTISIGEIDKAIMHELTIYSDEVTKKTKKASDEVMKNLVKNTKKDAPIRKTKNGGKYKKAISSKTTFENTRAKINVWYVKTPEYRLSHLLEWGHAKRNGGRTRAFNFIGKNEKIAIKDFEKKVEEAIESGT